MNLLLISPPTSKSLPGADFYFRMPTLGLLRVAGTTPPEWTVSILDETAEPIDAHARDLLARMIPYQLEWLGQASTDIARDDEVLDLCRKSGCMGLLIGFETLSRERLKAVRKGFNRPDDYLDAIRKIHDYGVGISGAFVFGLDGDDEGVFDRTYEFVQKAKLESPYFSILTPYPGTRLHRKLADAERIVDSDWSNYNTNNVVFRPQGMTAERLFDGYFQLQKAVHTVPAIAQRF